MYADSAMDAGSKRPSAESAASGNSQITYQGTSQAEATSSPSVAHPAGPIQPPGRSRSAHARRSSRTSSDDEAEPRTPRG